MLISHEYLKKCVLFTKPLPAASPVTCSLSLPSHLCSFFLLVLILGFWIILLVQFSGIISGRTWGAKCGGAGKQTGLTAYKTRTLPLYCLHDPIPCH